MGNPRQRFFCGTGLVALLFLSGKVVRLLKEYNEGVPYDRDRFLK